MSARKAYRYPTDDDDGDIVEGIDEQEQEEVIQSLAEKDEKTNELYRKLFLVFPLLALVHLTFCYFAYHGRSSGSFKSHPLYYISSLLALICSASLIYSDQPEDISRFLPEAYRRRHSEAVTLGRLLLIGSIAFTTSAFLDTTRFRIISSSGGSELPVYFSAVPVVVVCLIALVAQYELRPLDLRNLEDMKYNYKGA